ncbi:hypothetical protein PGT21_031580 [Puccinia graminis f. sp. tritici]|uniref:Transmembrane protein n=1 Tax=Puccinia graminis f. sp. tritici TaxID=56615 RepID=A0A5B0MQD6_PUCGR|nr:hypothetical protein PGT21_031580 [Puccinia graminis f. sp. tritici]
MSVSPLSAESNPSAALPTLNSMSLFFNPYPFIIKSIEDSKSQFAYRDLLSIDIVLIVVHFVLLIQATITLGLKLFFLVRNDQRSKIWLWRKHHLIDQPIPYLVPNANFVIEPLQIAGCIFFELFGIIIYMVIENPELGMSFPGLHASCLFWFAVSFVPGFIGFWLSGWSAFYVLFLSPTHDAGAIRRPQRIIHHPIFMNIMCIGIPVLMSGFFATIGILMTMKHKRVGDTFEAIIVKLDELSNSWQPNNPQTAENNQSLMDMMESLLSEGSGIFDLLQLMAIGWATIAMFIIMFYIGTTISVGKVTKRTMAIANGKTTLMKISSKYLLPKSKDVISESRDDLDSTDETACSQTAPELSPSFRNSVSANSIQRNLFFIRISCGLMIIALGFNFCTSLIVVVKIRSLLIETYWQVTLSSLIAVTCVLLSLSLLIQSLIHIRH